MTAKFHMIDTSMSNLVTMDDGVTLASVPEVAADSARLLRERSLYSTSAERFSHWKPIPDVTWPTPSARGWSLALELRRCRLLQRRPQVSRLLLQLELGHNGMC